MAKIYTAREPTRLAKAVTLAIYVEAATLVAVVLTSGYAATGAGQAFVADGVRASDLGLGIAALAYLAAMAMAGFLSLKWVYRVTRNAHSFAKGLTVSPPWSVGWFFIPVGCLFKPYEAVSEAWQASQQPTAWRTARKPAFLRWWWGSWLIANLLGSVSNVVSKSAASPTTSAVAMLIFALAMMVSCLLFVQVVKRLTALQHAQISFGMFDEADVARRAAAA